MYIQLARHQETGQWHLKRRDTVALLSQFKIYPDKLSFQPAGLICSQPQYLQQYFSGVGLKHAPGAI